MANSEIGMSAINTLGGEYEVFLSFRGPDTRRGFTDILHQALVDAGICVFIDDEELRLGERISGNLERAIDNSKLYIPIFSKTYASSHSCLHELARMVENTCKSREGEKKVMLPIFYDVKPDDVKLKTELYTETILNLEQKMEGQEKKFSSEDIKIWRRVLGEVNGIQGWELEQYLSHAKLIQAVVHEVVFRLETRERQVTKELVGMGDHIVAINNLLDIDSDGVRLIGIYGMGGIGKSTLAKIFFNQLSPRFGRSCSFLDAVRETEKTKGLIELQKKLLSDISYSRVAPNITNIEHGIKKIEETICNKKTLIVLDDVDKASQIQNLIGGKSLYPSTRILVTTRDQAILKIRGFKYKFEDYEMVGLSNKDTLKLFCRHAFNDSFPPADYYTFSKSMVCTTDRLPLALEAKGSMLFYFKEEPIWKEKLVKLSKTPHEDVWGKLRISYDALNPGEKQVFLDIAYLFIGENKTNPMYVWKDCEFYPEHAITILIKRCMIKVLDDDRFQMHDQFRDLGSAIAKVERTRLWDKDDIIDKLLSTEGSVQALRLPSRDSMTVTSEQIKLFPHMRLLWLDDVICQGELMGCLSELKWINLHYPPWQWPEAIGLLHLHKVVVANLYWLDFTIDALDSLIKGARKLKVFTLKYNQSIPRTPTFPRDSVLEKLTISGCRSLMEIDYSVGNLWRLTDLSVESCPALRNLPEQIGELRNLRHLSIMNCLNLTELPDSISQLVSLTKLDVSCTRITRLPDSVGTLPRLSSLDVSFTRIAEMPSTMSKFLHLQRLDMDHCHGIRELSMLPTSLTALRLRSASLFNVPNLSYLTNLVELLLSDETEATRTSYVIQTCDLRWIGRLSRLSKLHLCFLNGCAPATELSSLSMLKELTLYGLELQTFEQLPSNSLEQLTGRRNDFKTLAIPSILIKRKEAKGDDCYKQFEDQTVGAFKSMKRPRIEDCKSSEGLVCLSKKPGRNELESPELTYGWRGVFLNPSSLKMLREFHLLKCSEVRDIQFVSKLDSLEEFSVSQCISLKRIGGLSKVKNLKQLHIEWCENLQVVEGIYKLEFLRKLKIYECRSMKRTFDASRSKIPKECSIEIIVGESCRENIMNGTRQASDIEIETTDSETETETDIEIETTDSETETETEERVRFLSIHRPLLFLLLYLLSFSALF